MPNPAEAAVATLPSPWGPIHAAASDRGIVAIALLAPREAFLADLARSHHPLTNSTDRTSAAARHLEQLREDFETYFATGQVAFDVPLHLPARSAWDRLVLDGVRSIPAGSVASYGEVAARIGRFGRPGRSVARSVATRSRSSFRVIG